MRTAGLETAPPRAVRNCSKEAEGGEVNIYVILVKGEFMLSSTYLCKKFSVSHRELMSPRRDVVLC